MKNVIGKFSLGFGVLIMLLFGSLFLPMRVEAVDDGSITLTQLCEAIDILKEASPSLYLSIKDTAPILITVCGILDNIKDMDEVDDGEDEELVNNTGTKFAHNFIAESKSVIVSGSQNDRAEFILKFKLKSFGGDIYIPNLATNTSFATSSNGTVPSTEQGIGYHLQATGGIAPSVISATISSTAKEKSNSFLIEDDNEEEFTLKIIVSNDGGNLTNQSLRVILTGINWAKTDSAMGDAVYTLGLDDMKSSYEHISD